MEDPSVAQSPPARWNYVVPEEIRLKNNAEYNEQWLQARIAENPKILDSVMYRFATKNGSNT